MSKPQSKYMNFDNTLSPRVEEEEEVFKRDAKSQNEVTESITISAVAQGSQGTQSLSPQHLRKRKGNYQQDIEMKDLKISHQQLRESTSGISDFDNTQTNALLNI